MSDELVERLEGLAKKLRLVSQKNLVLEAASENTRLEEVVGVAEKFKTLVHRRLDLMGIDECRGNDCRVGARLDLIESTLATMKRERDAMAKALVSADTLIRTGRDIPTGDFDSLMDQIALARQDSPTTENSHD